MRKTFSILFLLLFSLLCMQCNRGDGALNKKLSEMAAGLNESTPVMLDQYTRFEEASVSPDNVFRYRYTVLNTTNPDSLIENISQSLKENIKVAFSTNAELRIFKENNVVIEYIYNDENNRTLRSLQITPEDYN